MTQSITFIILGGADLDSKTPICFTFGWATDDPIFRVSIKILWAQDQAGSEDTSIKIARK